MAHNLKALTALFKKITLTPQAHLVLSLIDTRSSAMTKYLFAWQIQQTIIVGL